MRLFLAVMCALWLLVPLRAGAGHRDRPVEDDETTARARVHLQAGVAHFEAGHYDDAKREMLEAFRLRPVPELQYNLAQCRERLGELEEALSSYRSYLEARPQAADRADVEQHLALIDKRLHERAGSLPAGEPEPQPLVEPVVPEQALPAPAQKVVFKELIVYRPPPPRAGRTARIAAFSLLGLAAVGLAAGVGLTVTANSASDELVVRNTAFNEQFGINLSQCSDMNAVQTAVQSAAAKDVASLGSAVSGSAQGAVNMLLISRYQTVAKGDCDFNMTAQSSVDQNRIAAYVGFGVMGAATAGAVGMFLYGHYLDKRQDRELARKAAAGPRISLLPYGGPGGGGLVLGGRF